MAPDEYVSFTLSKYAYAVAGGILVPPPVTAANKIIPQLNQWAGHWLANGISLSGSFAKGTAIRGGTDIDLFISLKSDTPGTLASIYDSLFKWSASAGWFPRAQNVSVGITYSGTKIDLVPARRQGSLTNLHSLHRSKTKSWTQTDVSKHINVVRSSSRLTEIRAVKIWRMLHGLDFPSFYLELTVIDALHGLRSLSPSSNIIAALKYIGERLETARVVDPANTGNIISNDLTSAEKRKIAQQATSSWQKPDWNQIIW